MSDPAAGTFAESKFGDNQAVQSTATAASSNDNTPSHPTTASGTDKVNDAVAMYMSMSADAVSLEVH